MMISRVSKFALFIIAVICVLLGVQHESNRLCQSSKKNTIDNHIYISEICSKNLFSFNNSFSNVEWWCELYNPSRFDINIDGYYLSDDFENPYKYRIVDCIVKGESYACICSYREKDTNDNNNIPFGINGGETLSLYDTHGNAIDRIEICDIEIDSTLGHEFDEWQNIGILSYATPGKDNSSRSILKEKELLDMSVVFSHVGGVYSHPIEVSLSSSDGIIFYTLDGSIPNENSLVYRAPITLNTEKTGKKKDALRQLSINDSDFATIYRINDTNHPCFVIRARIYKDNKMSDVFTNTYWISSKNPDIPVLSLTTSYEDLFGANGIIVGGDLLLTAKKKGLDNRQIGNWSVGRKINANIELYDGGEQILNKEAVISVAGNASKTWSQEKSLNVELLDNVSGNLLWGNDSTTKEVNSFTIRGQGTLNIENHDVTFFHDYLVNNIFQSFSSDSFFQNRLIQLFINGDYMGVYTLKERKDSQFFKNRFGIEIKDLEVIQVKSDIDNKLIWDVKYGDDDTLRELRKLYTLIKWKDFNSDEDYMWLESQIDTDSFIDFCICKIYVEGNTPTLDNNIIMWRYNGDSYEKGYKDGRWRYLSFDYDNTCSWTSDDCIQRILEVDADNNPTRIACLMFQKLYNNNDTFRNAFLSAFSDALRGPLSDDNTNRVIQSFEDMEPLMKEYLFCTEFQVDSGMVNCLNLFMSEEDKCRIIEPATYEDWNSDITFLKRFFKGRNAFFEREYFLRMP